ncbi:oligopeptide/dipeptide ABC transporter ATP-binding protein [Bradyrhizobium brasilense]|uniref:Oligopeptide/dipeptide ABC transporter C-terminal domain-containing protein n=1 Tax=Bradyrhizobium brasilense TaxID=1419277 RepID=A0ABY8JND0_9BRAD|nr:oligopeptide/dipeptide ABC transporter ATP-binding protein [Bradyrhizobium brasilense]WFU66674.1 hypothetical protein QA636_14675 [Bradyrhizobium brasilense]
MLEVENLGVAIKRHSRSSAGEAVVQGSSHHGARRRIRMRQEHDCAGIMGLLPPGFVVIDGRILLAGENVLTTSPKRLRALRGNAMSMIFQEPMTALNPLYTVGDQIAEVLRVHRGLGRADASEQAVAFPKAVQIPAADQRVHARGLTYIFISHDLGVIQQFCDEIAVMYLGKIVEQAPVSILFTEPRHPYTWPLIAAAAPPGPLRDALKKRYLVKGGPPSPVDPPPGCRFAQRCPFAVERCRQILPQLGAINIDHSVACHLAGKIEVPDFAAL